MKTTKILLFRQFSEPFLVIELLYLGVYNLPFSIQWERDQERERVQEKETSQKFFLLPPHAVSHSREDWLATKADWCQQEDTHPLLDVHFCPISLLTSDSFLPHPFCNIFFFLRLFLCFTAGISGRGFYNKKKSKNESKTMQAVSLLPAIYSNWYRNRIIYEHVKEQALISQCAELCWELYFFVAYWKRSIEIKFSSNI